MMFSTNLIAVAMQVSLAQTPLVNVLISTIFPLLFLSNYFDKNKTASGSVETLHGGLGAGLKG